VDFVRFGRTIRALRRRRHWRQSDLARVAGVSRSVIGRIERGSGRRATHLTLERVAEGLGARIQLRLDWNGEALDRLLDADHAHLVERVVAALAGLGWTSAIEATFAIAGERGAVDVLAFHSPTSRLLVIEVKTVVPDVQAMLSALDRKARLGRQIGGLRGWTPSAVGRVLVIRETRTARRRIEAHQQTFAAHLPDRNVAVRRWLADPASGSTLNGLWFLSDVPQTSARHRVTGPRPGPGA
jgi:transcriptional regulator with XRE-family HTH domain